MGSDTLVCNKCNGTKWFQYDHNHTQVCDACCKHEKGWWVLTKHHGKENEGKLCCRAGCGATKPNCKCEYVFDSRDGDYHDLYRCKCGNTKSVKI